MEHIKNYKWEDYPENDKYTWIKYGDGKYLFVKAEIIDKIFTALNPDDKKLLLDNLIWLINFICHKFNLDGHDNVIWNQLIQNDMRDLKALLAIMLPFIDTDCRDPRSRLKQLTDLYLEKNDKGKYAYTNSQYNRCIRYLDDHGKTQIIERPFIKEYFLQHLQLLFMSIDMTANKLYVNWVDVLPMPMNRFKQSQLYADTRQKLYDPNYQIVLLNDYIDMGRGLGWQDIYNVISNHLFHEIKNHKWLIYDIVVGPDVISYLNYLQYRLNFDGINQGKYWSQLNHSEQNQFTTEWKNFLTSINSNDNTVLHHFYFFFSKYHRNAEELIKKGELVLDLDLSDVEEDEENSRVTPETIRNARLGLEKVPSEEIYQFIFDQITAFKKSWFYYVVKIAGLKNLGVREFDSPVSGKMNIHITLKNVYNYCKSMIHFMARGKFTPMPRYWQTIKERMRTLFLARILDFPEYNDWRKPNWFNINEYLRRLYPNLDQRDLPQVNYLIHTVVREKLVDIIFESMIYHGLLSVFIPNENITNISKIESNINSKDDVKKNNNRYEQMKKWYFSGENKFDYANYSYYFLTGQTYGSLKPLRYKDYDTVNHEKTYFEYLTSNQIWTFTYAMNWVSQINFYHHYANNRVIYVTGSTGVGKSTQVPKLLMYCQKMIDYHSHGKIICTQPRISPTVGNALNISKEMGVPIETYNKTYDRDVDTNYYYVQYKYSGREHVNRHVTPFLRIVTDGTLYEEIKKMPFLTRSQPDKTLTDANGRPIRWAKTYMADNIYDIVIVDEAHEHGTNMDLILTLARDAVYVNNSLKLVIVSATMEDDEPIYRRYYRTINDNRAYPLSHYIFANELDRANIDRRIHISPPGETTQYFIDEIFLPKNLSNQITSKNFVEYGIKKTIEVVNSTNSGDILLFMSGKDDILRSIKEINAQTPSNIIALGFYGEQSDETKKMIADIHRTLYYYTRFKEDVFLEENEVKRRVPVGTYQRAIIVATNIAEASITLQNLRYVIDTGYSKNVVYDPVEGVTKVLTLPISKSSSRQRAGRVGRVAAGTVYFLYDQEKIANNKTTYQIANINVKDILVSLLTSEPNDLFIINQINDINHINNLIQMMAYDNDIPYDPKYLLIDILGNPQPYVDIIQQQYLYIPDPTNIRNYYYYYGRGDFEDYNAKAIKNDFLTYLRNNHDDYHYQKYLEFVSRGHTGYYHVMLKDQDVKFYVIHPDENVISRNLYTGRIESLQCNPLVTDSYYYYLLKTNDIKFQESQIKNCQRGNLRLNINFDKFEFAKYPLAMDDAKLQSLVIDIPKSNVDQMRIHSRVRDPFIRNEIDYFYQQDIVEEDYVTTKSKFLSDLATIQKITGLSASSDTNYLLWYSYAIPYHLENDVMALELLMKVLSNLAKSSSEFRNPINIQKFLAAHANSQGDIYFFWKLWIDIKEILTLYIDKLPQVVPDLDVEFRNLKNQYLSRKKIPYEQYVTLDKMYYSGQLNSRHEFYYYLRQAPVNFDDIITNNDDKMLVALSQRYQIDPNILVKFVTEYLEMIFDKNKSLWIHQYQLINELTEESLIDPELIGQKMKFPQIISNYPNSVTEWDRILETYLRAYSINLVRYLHDRYLRIAKGFYLDPDYWSKKIQVEKTFLTNKTPFLIYHNSETIGDSEHIIFLTPVKIEWIFQLNPIYYYYLLFDKNNLLNQMKEDNATREAKKIIAQNKDLFDYNALNGYLQQLNDPILTEIVRDHFQSTKN